MAFKIKDITAREILDSRGDFTISVKVCTDDICAEFSVPSGASVGKYEAVSKKDKKESIKNIQEIIAPKLKGIDVREQKAIDDILIALDATENKSNLGADAIIGVSAACAKTAAKACGFEVYEYIARLMGNKKPSPPFLYMNLVNAGKHSSCYLAFQEYMVVPCTDNIEEAITIGTGIMREMKKGIRENYSMFSLNIGDEGGYVLEAKKVEEPLQLLTTTINCLGLKNKVKLALDVAASSFYENELYRVDEKKMAADELTQIYKNITDKYDILSIEDPFEENDFENFASLLSAWENGIVVGDDLTVTNLRRLKQAHKLKSINAIIIKPNQIGTLSEVLDIVRFAGENGIKCIVSHRSGETNDDFVADLAYGISAFGIKAGALRRGERVAKYNRLWDISKRLKIKN